MARISFALLEVNTAGASVEVLASRLNLTPEFVAERIEAARLCLMLTGDGSVRQQTPAFK